MMFWEDLKEGDMIYEPAQGRYYKFLRISRMSYSSAELSCTQRKEDESEFSRKSVYSFDQYEYEKGIIKIIRKRITDVSQLQWMIDNV